MIVPSLLGAPLPAPRVPYGLGSLSVESEAVDAGGRQVAAMVWSRGAGVLATSATVSQIGDAYDLGGSFGSDFGQMLATGKSPFGHLAPLPSIEQIGTTFGGAPKQAACEAYGRAPGVGGMLGSAIGLPPEWTDEGRAEAAKP